VNRSPFPSPPATAHRSAVVVVAVAGTVGTVATIFNFVFYMESWDG